MHPIVFGLNLPSLGRIDGWMVKCQTAENLSSTYGNSTLQVKILGG